MPHLSPEESRVLGVLVEKAQTTPGQYPLTLNAMLSGCNQKSNRMPVTSLSEEQVLEAVDGLRSKDLVREVQMTGSRVPKYRHVAREGLAVTTSELVVLAELLLRGPQTVGELRGRASRMHPLESIEVVGNVLTGLMERDEPFAERIGPAPGSRADRYRQLLCPDLHPLTAAASAAPAASGTAGAPAGASADDDLRARVDRLEREVAELRAMVEAGRA
ncbi:MAG: YceH family protein [Planctomycetota bacterium]|jgi:uncharacterized protein YceH (UPF0502 family)